jgi:hypothetical protein
MGYGYLKIRHVGRYLALRGEVNRAKRWKNIRKETTWEF